MKELKAKYIIYYSNKDFLFSCFITLLFLSGSLVLQFYAGIYATESASNSVTDIILSNTRTFDLDGIFIYGSIMFWIFIGVLCIIKPERIPFTLKSTSLFVLIRSVFISMTHIGPFPTQVIIDSASIVSYFTFGGDLFFSGHTGLPFLMALIFWQNIKLRIIFICLAIMFGIVVLLTHLHYSIDVLAAFFITYTIFHIAEYLFTKDRLIFFRGLA